MTFNQKKADSIHWSQTIKKLKKIMNKFTLHINGQRPRTNILKGFYHAPLIVDAASQTVYRKSGFASWPVTKNQARIKSLFHSVRLAYIKFWEQMPGVKNILGL